MLVYEGYFNAGVSIYISHITILTFATYILNFSRNSRLEVFCKKGIFKSFAKYTGKHLCQSLVFNKATGMTPATLICIGLLYRFVSRNFLVLLYSVISIKWTHHKADIPVRRTVTLGTERFPGQTLM